MPVLRVAGRQIARQILIQLAQGVLASQVPTADQTTAGDGDDADDDYDDYDDTDSYKKKDKKTPNKVQNSEFKFLTALCTKAERALVHAALRLQKDSTGVAPVDFVIELREEICKAYKK